MRRNLDAMSKDGIVTQVLEAPIVGLFFKNQGQDM
jgi:hypothetical protein